MMNTDDENLKMQGARGVLVNVNEDDYDRYIRQRNALNSKDVHIARLDGEINKMKEDLSKITALLQQLVQGNK
jgi:hypothetical protein